jgi:hypothetical protein
LADLYGADTPGKSILQVIAHPPAAALSGQ